ncbi:alpha/beta fold hydrolase [Polymorphobacter sp.]|uniref:alpha/beta fold hydrolase n=1 Tax=Polymorphobacter sp. TaxID=1909290 RepID=UPI003F712867
MALFLVPVALSAGAAAEPRLSFAALEAAHAEPGSRFADVDGVRLHYVDEGPNEGRVDGRAPVIVLLNASYLNLSSWAGVAARLKAGHRVIRMDFPTVGLSQALRDEALDIRAFEGQVLGLMDRLGVAKATLVGTSSGAIVAFRVASEHPERFERLVLLNAAGLPRTAATDPLRQRPRLPGAPAPGSRAFWDESLRANFSDPARVREDFVSQVYDWSRREGVEREGQVFLKTFGTGDPKGVLGRISLPTLILWGEKGTTLSHLEAEVFGFWLTGAPRMIRKYADAGHYPQVEQPAMVAEDIAAFVGGKLDAGLLPASAAPARTLAEVPFWQRTQGYWTGLSMYNSLKEGPSADQSESLTETRVDGERMTDTEYRYYPPGERTRKMSGVALAEGEGLEVVRVLEGRMADGSGRVVMAPQTGGQYAGKQVVVAPLGPDTAMMTVAAPGGPESYRIHIDATAPDRRLRMVIGLQGPDEPGALRAVAAIRERRISADEMAAMRREMRARFKVGAVLTLGVDGMPVVSRP